VCALTLLLGWFEAYLASKNLCNLSPKVLFQNKCKKKTEDELADPGSAGKRLIKWKWFFYVIFHWVWASVSQSKENNILPFSGVSRRMTSSEWFPRLASERAPVHMKILNQLLFRIEGQLAKPVPLRKCPWTWCACGVGRFRSLCIEAYQILRGHYNFLITLFLMMMNTGLPEVSCLEDVDYLRKTLVPSYSDEEAVEFFKGKFQEALHYGWKASANNVFHLFRVGGNWTRPEFCGVYWPELRHSFALKCAKLIAATSSCCLSSLGFWNYCRLGWISEKKNCLDFWSKFYTLDALPATHPTAAKHRKEKHPELKTESVWQSSVLVQNVHFHCQNKWTVEFDVMLLHENITVEMRKCLHWLFW